MSKKKIKIDFQKVFCTISIGFICACVLFYGARFMSLYLENKKDEESTSNTLGKVVINNNYGNENFKDVNGEYYFQKEGSNNYVKYSNILWRIVKVKSNNEVVLISDYPLTTLAYKESSSFADSYVNMWLNNIEEENNSGILQNNLNNIEKYLVKNETCITSINDVTNEECSNVYNENYIGLLSINDYVSTGSEESFVNNGTRFYLSNSYEDGKVWYIDTNKLALTDGTDLIGIRPVITISKDTNIVSGNGSTNSPYMFEEESSYFGSYVKLGEDIWQVYNEDETTIDLVRNTTLDETKEYASSGYEYNTYSTQNIAYYLNNNYLNSLSYKDIIQEKEYNNGYYGADNNYDYRETLNTKITAKVGLLNITNIKLNHDIKDYFLMTGNTKNGSLVYLVGNNGSIYPTSSDEENNILPTISIKKEVLTKGEGTINSPYEVE